MHRDLGLTPNSHKYWSALGTRKHPDSDLISVCFATNPLGCKITNKKKNRRKYLTYSDFQTFELVGVT